jgi:hypothetical protein
MMTRSLAPKAAAAFGILLLAGAAQAQNYYVPGSYVSETGLGNDWDPPTAPLMTETSVGSNIFNLDFTLTGAPAGTGFAFKILNSPDNSPAWGDPEITPNDVPFDAAVDPNMSIRLDRNTYSDGYFPTTNRVAILDDWTTWTAIGNFQTQLGSAGDYNNSFAGTAMTETSLGSGIYSLTTTIPTAGNYAWRAVKTGTFNGVGTNGRWGNAANMAFSTFEDGQEVTFEMNTNIGAIRYLTEAVLAGDTNNNGLVEFNDFTPIRDNFLNTTNLRANGDLDGNGFVDIADFREWKNAFSGPPALIQMALAQLQSVPEPSSLALIGLATAFFAGSRRRAA